VLPDPLPLPPKVVKAPEISAQKRAAPDDEEVAEEPPVKRARTNGFTMSNVLVSPSKKRKLDEDGILLLEAPNEKVDVNIDVIEID
jgi:ubiquitin-like 1-activating enzyme E1 B